VLNETLGDDTDHAGMKLLIPRDESPSVFGVFLNLSDSLSFNRSLNVLALNI
jgi:hypothetical protein